MGGGFRVTYVSLVDAAGGIDAVVENLAAGRLNAITGCGETGSTALDGALGGFATAWMTGLALLIEDQHHSAQHLRNAATSYGGVDVDLAFAVEQAIEKARHKESRP